MEALMIIGIIFGMIKQTNLLGEKKKPRFHDDYLKEFEILMPNERNSK